MLTFVVVLFFARTGALAVIDPSIATMINTAMNAAMLVYIARLDRRVAPKVEHIESELSTRQKGGARRYDPPDDGDSNGS